MALLRRLARALIADRATADDLVQETLTIAWERRSSIPKGQTLPWLKAVLRKRGWAHLRRRSYRDATQVDQGMAATDQAPDEVAARLEQQGLVHQALVGLDDPYRTVLVLHFQDGLSAAEIARRRGAPESTIRSYVRRGLERMRTSLDEFHNGDRETWLGALAPLAALVPMGRASSPTTLLPATATGSTFLLMNSTTILSLCSALAVAAIAGAVLFDVDGAKGLDRPLATATEPNGNSQATRTSPVLAEAPGRIALNVEPPSPGTSESPEATDMQAPSHAVTGRVLFADGSPMVGIEVAAKRIEGGRVKRIFERVTTLPDGRFAFIDPLPGVDLDQPFSLRLCTMASPPQSSPFYTHGVVAPTNGLELRIDAILARLRAPGEVRLVVEEDECVPEMTISRYITALSATPGEWDAVSSAGYESHDGRFMQLLEVGSGYHFSVTAKNGQPLAALIPPDAPGGIYDLDLVEDVPGAGAVKFVLSGAPPQGVAIDVELQPEPKADGIYQALSLHPGHATVRTGSVVPGRYHVEVSADTAPPESWYSARATNTTVDVVAGTEAIVELEVMIGGLLDVQILADAVPDGPSSLRVEEFHSSHQRWYTTLLFPVDPESQLEATVGTRLRSPTVIPAGPLRLRVHAEGFESLEETIEVKPGEPTYWRPRLEAVSALSVR